MVDLVTNLVNYATPSGDSSTRHHEDSVGTKRVFDVAGPKKSATEFAPFDGSDEALVLHGLAHGETKSVRIKKGGDPSRDTIPLGNMLVTAWTLKKHNAMAGNPLGACRALVMEGHTEAETGLGSHYPGKQP